LSRQSLLRAVISAATGVAAALALPVYPWQGETRNQVIGHAGDVITHDWALEWCFVLPDRARYVDEPALPLLLDAALFVTLAALVAFGVYRKLARHAR
jgi:hypothetical protein